MILKLLLNRGLQIKNTFLDSGSGIKRYRLLSLGVLFILPVYIYAQINQLFKSWSVLSDNALLPATGFVNLSLLGLFALLVFTGIPLSLHLPFVSKDLSLLRSLPLPEADIWAAKFIQGCLINSTLFLYFGLPLLIAFYINYEISAWFLFIVLLAVIAFLALAYAIANICAILLLTALSAQRAKYITTILVAFVFVALWAGFQLFRFSQLDPISTSFNPQRLEQLAQFNTHSWLDLLPSHWLVNIFSQSAQNHPSGAIVRLFPILLVTIPAIMFSFILTRKLKTFQENRPALIHKHQTEKHLEKKRPPFLALLIKDLNLIIRDARQFAQSIIFLIMLMVFPFIIYEKNDLLSLFDFHAFASLLLFTAIFAALSTVKLLAIERKSFYHLKKAPLASQTLFGAKWFTTYATFLPVATLALAILSVLSSAPLQFFGIFFIILNGILAGAVALGMVVAIYFVNFNWDHPRNMLHSGGTLWLMLAIILFGSIDFLILALGYMTDLFLLSLLLSTGYAVVVFLSGTYITQKKLEKLEWIY
ncbi:hypothetical protein GF407_13635 [candidate division KSB1 bacterium]|nr:hypothetical protein [candidate division KSB1 bacterium]